jgi:hypothetical protein
MGVGLVCDDAVRATPWATAEPGGGDADVVDQWHQLRVVSGVAGGEPH